MKATVFIVIPRMPVNAVLAQIHPNTTPVRALIVNAFNSGIRAQPTFDRGHFVANLRIAHVLLDRHEALLTSGHYALLEAMPAVALPRVSGAFTTWRLGTFCPFAVAPSPDAPSGSLVP